MSTLAPLSSSSQGSQRAIAALIMSGWVIILLYFPSGLLHLYFNVAVYGRDLLLGAHLAAGIVFLRRLGHLDWVLKHSAILALVPLFLLPAALNHDFTLEAMRTVKWCFCWLDWIILGHLAFLNRRWHPWLGIFIGITLLELLVEAFVGLYEWHRGEYLFSPAWGEKTALGVLEVSNLRLENHIRIRGLQRDVFSFANLMAMSATAGLAWASTSRVMRDRLIGFALAAFFATMLVISGGRSSLFGIAAATLLAAAYCADISRVRPFAKIYVLVWVGIGLLISLVGVGPLSETVSGVIFGGSHVGDATSAYMRDENWKNMFAAFNDAPIIMAIGGPFASLLDSNVAPMFHWADNQFLWDLYHLGAAGFCAIAFYFFSVLKRAGREVNPRAVDVLIFFLLFVLGEGIARESLTFMGCMPLFLACGFVSAGSRAAERNAAGRIGETPSGQVRRRRRSLSPLGPKPPSLT